MKHHLIAKEGWLFIAIAAIVTVLLFYINVFCGIPALLLTVFILQFFRDPERFPPSGNGLILSPADGRIIAIEKTTDRYQNIQAIRVSIFMNVFNVHSNKSPVDGEILDIQYKKGKFLNASLDKSSEDNEQNALIIKTESGTIITVVQIAGLIARRILCYKKIGDKISRGERYGFIKFGSRVDVYLPLDAVISVTLGQTIYAVKDVIAVL